MKKSDSFAKAQISNIDTPECYGVLGSHPLCSTDYCPCKEGEIENWNRTQ